MTPVRVLAVASEVYPIVKTGGLADVAGALPIALKAHGVEMRTLMPAYPDVMRLLSGTEEIRRWPDYFGGPGRLLAGSRDGLDLFVLDVPHLYARPGNPYVTAEGVDWPDNGVRFAALARVAADIGRGLVPAFVPDVVHAHDWQAGLAPAYLHYDGGPRPGTVMTIHNMAYQGKFDRALADAIGLPRDATFDVHGLEYFGGISFLKAGLQLADRITTVSPTYAREIQSDEGGMGLGGLLRARASVLSGILNGIDIEVWNPQTDPHIAYRFGPEDLVFRAANKAVLQQQFNLDSSDEAPLLGVISRLSWQKGLDLLLEAIPTILDQGMQLALLGSGDRDLQDRYQAAARANPGRIGVMIGYDEILAHLIQAGSDALVVPSRFEPCGLTQLCALRYGAIPIVSRVGGLEDTIIDGSETGRDATGFKFAPVTADALAGSLRRANAAFHDKPTWRRLQRSGLATDVSWRHRAGEYAALYRDLIASRRA
ncbi:glycogen synthase GlgA [Bradyrhizobium sp. INPA01-394B]|uniref:Glycogen synthase n=1 Tax=Bradyrhizobium campsiandrae TaxID=1729892 RepID=A0ABR7UBM7_9BRAD|nr:glycogen synthase GlgA [Bradyrhizobium campsiandrae]MBC9878902.1 glycogen synthase GlgA [Bradyrhizobium campsiandrae]MBC9980837.1 glycogen synthase GlgA [Bradyrhizobium campsiandrae]